MVNVDDREEDQRAVEPRVSGRRGIAEAMKHHRCTGNGRHEGELGCWGGEKGRGAVVGFFWTARVIEGNASIPLVMPQ